MKTYEQKLQKVQRAVAPPPMQKQTFQDSSMSRSTKAAAYSQNYQQ